MESSGATRRSEHQFRTPFSVTFVCSATVATLARTRYWNEPYSLRDIKASARTRPRTVLTAVLTVIARQVQRGGVCVLPIDAIAALAGVSRTMVKTAMRQAKLIGLILVKERRIPGRKSLTNIVSIISKDWSAWLKLIGGRKPPSTNSHFSSRGESARIVPRGGVGKSCGETTLRRRAWREGT